MRLWSAKAKSIWAQVRLKQKDSSSESEWVSKYLLNTKIIKIKSFLIWRSAFLSDPSSAKCDKEMSKKRISFWAEDMLKSAHEDRKNCHRKFLNNFTRSSKQPASKRRQPRATRGARHLAMPTQPSWVLTSAAGTRKKTMNSFTESALAPTEMCTRLEGFYRPIRRAIDMNSMLPLRSSSLNPATISGSFSKKSWWWRIAATRTSWPTLARTCDETSSGSAWSTAEDHHYKTSIIVRNCRSIIQFNVVQKKAIRFVVCIFKW